MSHKHNTPKTSTQKVDLSETSTSGKVDSGVPKAETPKAETPKIPVNGETAQVASDVQTEHEKHYASVVSAIKLRLTSEAKGKKDKDALESKPYELLFDVLTKTDSFLGVWGTKKNAERPDFPKGKKFVDPHRLYKDVVKMRVDVPGGYVHYVNNRFHFFVKAERVDYFPKERERDLLKNVKGEETSKDEKK